MWSNMALQTFRFDLNHRFVIDGIERRTAVCELPVNPYTSQTEDAIVLDSNIYELMKKEDEMSYENYVAAFGMDSGEHSEYNTKRAWLGGHQGVIKSLKKGASPYSYCKNEIYVVANFRMYTTTPTTGTTRYYYECTNIGLTGFVSLPATLNFYMDGVVKASLNSGVYERSGSPLFLFYKDDNKFYKPGVSITYNGITLSDNEKTYLFNAGEHAYEFCLSNE